MSTPHTNYSIERMAMLASDPSLLRNEDRASVNRFVQEYPWFNTARLLQVIDLHQTRDINLDKMLATTSVSIYDRNRLYLVLYGDKVRRTIKRFEAQIEQEASNDQMDEDSSNPEEKEGQASPSEKDEGMAILETQILEAAMSASLQLEQEALVSESGPNQSSQQDQEVADLRKGKRSLREWMQCLIMEESTAIPSSEYGKVFIPTSAAQGEKKAFYSPTEMARISLVDNEEFVTETLAGIYARQDQLDKAIRAYRVLGLNNPEKSSYFAARIEALTELKKKKGQ